MGSTKLHLTPPSVHTFGPSGLTDRLRECRSGGKQSWARAGGRGRRAGPGHPRADALAGIVLHHLTGHLGQDALSQRRGCGLRVGGGGVIRSLSSRGGVRRAWFRNGQLGSSVFLRTRTQWESQVRFRDMSAEEPCWVRA